jgi:hypothetical protein
MALEGISKRFSSLRHFCSGIRRRLRTTQVVIWSKDNVASFLGRDQKLEATSSVIMFTVSLSHRQTFAQIRFNRRSQVSSVVENSLVPKWVRRDFRACPGGQEYSGYARPTYLVGALGSTRCLSRSGFFTKPPGMRAPVAVKVAVAVCDAT